MAGEKTKHKPRRLEDDAVPDLSEELTMQKKITGNALMRSLMNLAVPAIGLKKRVLNDESAPLYLRLQNANDILDRTLPKPTQSINLNSTVLQANYTDRELKEILVNRLAKKGIMIGGE